MSADHNPVSWFEIPVIDLARAKDFYDHFLGLQLEVHEMGPRQMAWFPMRDGYGTAGSLVKEEGLTPSMAGTMVYFTSADIDAALARAKEKGGRTILPKTDIGEYGFIAVLRDSEGNRIALHTMK